MSDIRAVSFEGGAENNIRLSFNSKKSSDTRSSERNQVKDIMADLDFLNDKGYVPPSFEENNEDDVKSPLLANVIESGGKLSPPPQAVNSPSKMEKPVETWYHYWTTYTEDGIGLVIGLTIFFAVLLLSAGGVNINHAYATSSEWPFGAFLIGIVIIIFAHWVLKKPQVFEPYCVIMLIAIISRAIGNYKALVECGLSASLWCVLIGIFIRSCGVTLTKGVFSGEFFVKIGVCLMNMDFVSIVAIGAPGLAVAWLDTVLVLGAGVFIATHVYKFDLLDGIVVSGATCICGSSAATAISSSIHTKGYEDPVCKTIIAIMGVFNAPLMPLMPLAKTVFHANPAVVGAWIGGSIDSTGQVVASAEMGGEDVLKTAVIIKMAQNILIGPLCLFFTGYFHNSFQPAILINRFPLFVVGFLITSTITTIILNNDASDSTHQEESGVDMVSLTRLIVENSWCIAEWVTLIGFACIGLEIDISKFYSSNKGDNTRKVLALYLCVQFIDICTTFGWSYLMFYNYDWGESDGGSDKPAPKPTN